jgi:hypothetical protein
MTEPVSRRAKIARKLYITAWWLLGAGWLIVSVGSFVALRQDYSEHPAPVAARHDDEWEDITHGEPGRLLSPEEVKALGLDKPSAQTRGRELQERYGTRVI